MIEENSDSEPEEDRNERRRKEESFKKRSPGVVPRYMTRDELHNLGGNEVKVGFVRNGTYGVTAVSSCERYDIYVYARLPSTNASLNGWEDWMSHQIIKLFLNGQEVTISD